MSVACEIGIRPEYVCSYVATCQLFGPVNGAERYCVANGLMPRMTASVRTNILNVEPACLCASAAMSNESCCPVCATAIARMSPVPGSMETIDPAGSPLLVERRRARTASRRPASSRRASCRRVRPPCRTRPAPYSRTSCDGDEVGEIRPGGRALRSRGMQAERACERGSVARLGDVAGGEHRLQHLRSPLLRRRRGARSGRTPTATAAARRSAPPARA